MTSPIPLAIAIVHNVGGLDKAGPWCVQEGSGAVTGREIPAVTADEAERWAHDTLREAFPSGVRIVTRTKNALAVVVAVELA